MLFNKIVFNILIILISTTRLSFSNECINADESPFTEADFPQSFPKEIMEKIEKNKNRSDLQQALNHCSSNPEYIHGMTQLEDAIMRASLNTPSVNKEMRTVSNNLFHWIEKIADFTKLKDATKTKEQIVDDILRQFFGKCSSSSPGCVGSDPKKIKDAFKNGNLRELSYILNIGAVEFITDFFGPDCVQEVCPCNDISEVYNSEIPVLKQMGKICVSFMQGVTLQSRGRYARLNKYFKNRVESNRFYDENTELKIPLSKREKEFIGKGGFKWKPGSEYYNPSTDEQIENLIKADKDFPDPENLYYKTAKRFGHARIVAMSGTTDSLLTLACTLGESDPMGRQNLMLAAAGNMLSHGHHSMYEILVGARSFQGLHEIPLNSDYYKYILPGTSFPNDVEKIYKNGKNTRLPTEIYLACLNEQLNHEIPPHNSCKAPGTSIIPIAPKLEDTLEKVGSFQKHTENARRTTISVKTE